MCTIKKKDDDRCGSLRKAQKTVGNFISVTFPTKNQDPKKWML